MLIVSARQDLFWKEIPMKILHHVFAGNVIAAFDK
jgi:hypothetical protein